MLSKTRRQIIRRIKSQCYIDYGSDYSNTIFLAGCGRSGTTWLSEVLNYKRDRRYIFEPFHPLKVNLARRFKNREYIKPDNRDQNYIKPVEKILSGRVRSYWTDKFNQTKISNKRLIKAIRANLLLKWLKTVFPEVPIIYLLRHPLAVAVSRSKYKGWNQKSLDVYLEQADLMEDYLKPFSHIMASSEAKFKDTGYCTENHLLSWCIENYIVLKQFKLEEIYIVFYENCCVDPAHEIERLFSYLSLNFDQSIFESMGTASKVSRKDSAILTGQNLVSNWKQSLSSEEIKYFFDLISLFGLNRIYSEDSMPDSVALNRFMSE